MVVLKKLKKLKEKENKKVEIDMVVRLKKNGDVTVVVEKKQKKWHGEEGEDNILKSKVYY